MLGANLHFPVPFHPKCIWIWDKGQSSCSIPNLQCTTVDSSGSYSLDVRACDQIMNDTMKMTPSHEFIWEMGVQLYCTLSAPSQCSNRFTEVLIHPFMDTFIYQRAVAAMQGTGSKLGFGVSRKDILTLESQGFETIPQKSHSHPGRRSTKQVHKKYLRWTTGFWYKIHLECIKPK